MVSSGLHGSRSARLPASIGGAATAGFVRLPLGRRDRARPSGVALLALRGLVRRCLGLWDTGAAWATRASVSSKSTHKSPLRQTHIGGMQAGPRGLAHMCGLLAGAHMRLVG